MRIVVTSDSHGRRSKLLDIVEAHMEDASLFVNLGDCNSGSDLEDIQACYGNKLNLICVSGNCDFSGKAPNEQIIRFAGKKIILCHGHTYGVKHGLSAYMEKAQKEGADIALYGHTHTPCVNYMNGIHFFNPGAVLNGEYGMVDITDSGIICINAKI